jgi:O-antigen/teichoic acid export membrane protein
MARNQWLLADQVLVSGMNFLTSALLARMLGVRNFGIFSVFYIILQYLNSIQMALIIAPMMTFAPQMQDAGERRSYLRGQAGYQYLFSVSCGAAILLYTLFERLHMVRWRMDPGVVLPFIFTIICFQAQDWFRRFCYTQDRGRTVFWNDVISYSGQVVFFGLLWWLHRMSVNAAYYAIAVTSLAAFAAGFVTEDIGCTWEEIKLAFVRSWSAGRNLLVASQSQWLGSQGIFLIVAGVAGVSAASGIRAASILLGPVIMLYQLLDNVIPVRAARAYATGGELSLVRYLQRTGVTLAMIISVPILLACVFARPIMTLVFGPAYGGFASLVIWSGIYNWLMLIYRGFVYYYRTLNKTTLLARSAMVVAAVSVTACLLLTRRYGATGCMEALVAGQAVNVSILLYYAMRTHRLARVAA